MPQGLMLLAGFLSAVLRLLMAMPAEGLKATGIRSAMVRKGRYAAQGTARPRSRCFCKKIGSSRKAREKQRALVILSGVERERNEVERSESGLMDSLVDPSPALRSG